MHSEMAKLHSASPREITSPFPHEIISKLHSKACNYLYLLLHKDFLSRYYSCYFSTRMNGLPIRGLLRNTIQLSTARTLVCLIATQGQYLIELWIP